MEKFRVQLVPRDPASIEAAVLSLRQRDSRCSEMNLESRSRRSPQLIVRELTRLLEGDPSKRRLERCLDAIGWSYCTLCDRTHSVGSDRRDRWRPVGDMRFSLGVRFGTSRWPTEALA